MRCSIIRFGLQDEYVGRNFFKFFKEVQFLTGG